ncbi:MAG: hypothetical protein MdMp014T_2818 [Treponematales bacterium]
MNMTPAENEKMMLSLNADGVLGLSTVPLTPWGPDLPRNHKIVAIDIGRFGGIIDLGGKSLPVVIPDAAERCCSKGPDGALFLDPGGVQIRDGVLNWASSVIQRSPDKYIIRTQADYDRYSNAPGARFVINAKEKITVRRGCSFEAVNESPVEAFGGAHVTARDKSYIVAHGSVSVEAFDQARVDAADKTTVSSSNSSLVRASGTSAVTAYNTSKVKAAQNAQVDAYDSVKIIAHDNASVRAHDKAVVEARDNAQVIARDASQVIAHDKARVQAYDNTKVSASGSAKINVTDRALVTASDSAEVTAHGNTVVLSTGSPKVSADVTTLHIPYELNTPSLLKTNLDRMVKLPAFYKNPRMAASVLLKTAPAAHRESFKKELSSLGVLQNQTGAAPPQAPKTAPPRKQHAPDYWER